MKFTEYGKKNSDTIILLHGAGLSSWNYRREAGILASRFHVILPVLDGHEGSDRPFTSIKSAAEEIIDFIRVGGETRSHRNGGFNTPVLAPGKPEA